MSTVATKTKGYLVRHVRDAQVVPCPCGASHRIFTRADTPLANLHVTEITDSRKHYHQRATEMYYILEGTGKMELNDDVIDLTPGLAILIEPGTAHRVYGNIKTMVIVLPATDHHDEYFCDAH